MSTSYLHQTLKLPSNLLLSRSSLYVAGNVKAGHRVVNYVVKLEATVDTKP